jgi:hypothetical protein
MTKTKPPVLPANRPTESEWFREFKVGILAKKPNDRPRDLMNMWLRDGQNSLDFSYAINKLKVS